MFFIGIFGIDQKNKLIKILHNLNCSKCNKISEGKLIKSFSYFHLFFIPIFKWNERYYVECSSCNTIFELKKEIGKAIERGEREEITYWDLENCEVKRTHKVCERCGRSFDDEFEYCPYCGEKLK